MSSSVAQPCRTTVSPIRSPVWVLSASADASFDLVDEPSSISRRAEREAAPARSDCLRVVVDGCLRHLSPCTHRHRGCAKGVFQASASLGRWRSSPPSAGTYAGSRLRSTRPRSACTCGARASRSAATGSCSGSCSACSRSRSANVSGWLRSVVLEWVPLALSRSPWTCSADRPTPVLLRALPAADPGRRALFGGTVPTVWLQDRLWDGASQVHWYDYASGPSTSATSSPRVLAGVLWFVARARFRRYVATVALLAAMGFATFAFPAAPPGSRAARARSRGRPVRSGRSQGRSRSCRFPSRPVRARRGYANPVAAVPSLHAAYTPVRDLPLAGPALGAAAARRVRRGDGVRARLHGRALRRGHPARLGVHDSRRVGRQPRRRSLLAAGGGRMPRSASCSSSSPGADALADGATDDDGLDAPRPPAGCPGLAAVEGTSPPHSWGEIEATSRTWAEESGRFRQERDGTTLVHDGERTWIATAERRRARVAGDAADRRRAARPGGVPAGLRLPGRGRGRGGRGRCSP